MAEEVKLDGNAELSASSTRQRKKRKWDQPAESIIAATALTPGLLPLNSGPTLADMSLPCIFSSLVGVYPTMPTAASAQMPSPFSTVQQNAAAIVQKINQDLVAKGLVPPSKIQDELIAREIIINDAEPGVRYKLTKRQTQEEIQSKTGAVVITRGRYKPSNGPPDHEKPLYLHISAGAQLKDTAERVRAVDQAAVLVDEMLKQGRQVLGSSSTGQPGMSSPMSAVVFVDFEADSSLDLISRIRGPNDQYINHIMNETGATVLLKGGACEGSCSEDLPQPLHLLISAEHAKSVEDARSLTEHLLETIRSEVVGSRPPHFPPPVSYNLQQLPPPVSSTLESGNAHFVSIPQQLSVIVPGMSVIMPGIQSSIANSAGLPTVDLNARLGSFKNYSAVPPPKQLLTVDAGSGKIESSVNKSLDATALLSPSAVSSALAPIVGHPALPTAPVNQNLPQQIRGIYPQASRGSESYPSYSAYSGLYPRASPLQQVALALQRPASSQGSAQPPSFPPESHVTMTLGQTEKQERQRRKFQEGPALKREPLADQGRSFETPAVQLMPPPRSIFVSPPGSMPPPPPLASMSPPSPGPALLMSNNRVSVSMLVAPNAIPRTSFKSTSPPAPPGMVPVPQVKMPGLKLVEYGEDEDEDEDEDGAKDELNGGHGKGPMPYANGKPFWAV